MGRSWRGAVGGYVYHVLNRANARDTLFDQPGDYEAFERVLTEAQQRYDTRLLAYCIMPNHWHLVVWPRRDDELSRFVGWLTLTHTQRWHAHRQTAGTGHLYQGRFKSFPIQEDEHLFAVIRYVERNPLRAHLVRQALHWRYGSLWRRERGVAEAQQLLSDGPLPLPADWASRVQAAQTEAELTALRRSVARGQPYGADAWVRATASRLGLETTLRPRGRPRKLPEKGS